ncbi:MAG: ATP-dependent helicase HrpB [Verrucomicrobiota bacterium]
MPERLPIHQIADEIESSLRRGDEARLVVAAPTGSGKSTQLPQIVLDRGLAGDGKIVVLQPRRIAARMLARRIASERHGRVGDEVGYQVRFENHSTRKTRIEFVTDGLLVRRFLRSPGLEDTSVIVFDEFHERGLDSDLALALALKTQSTARPDLKIVVMSATLKTDEIARFLGSADVLETESRAYPVDIHHQPLRAGSQETAWDGATRAFTQQRHALGDEGHALVFMPGVFEIRKTIETLKRSKGTRGLDILPLYGDLPPEQQDAAVEGGARQKIIVATNVAETSLTIDGVRLVIDSGLARIADYDPRREINTLTMQKIARDSADQRAGRAGRTGPGSAVRLWSEADHAKRPAGTLPEIERLDLSELLLFLKASHIGSTGDLQWITPPPRDALEKAHSLLHQLGALDASSTITETGREMAGLPVHPRFARLILAAGDFGCVEEAALAAAFCQGKSLWTRNPGPETRRWRERFFDDDDTSDFQPLLRAWSFARERRFDRDQCESHGIHAMGAREAGKIAKELTRALGSPRNSGTMTDGNALAKSLLLAFSDHLAVRKSNATLSCHVAGGRSGTLEKESVARNGMIFVCAEISEIEGKTLQTNLRLATLIEPDWLHEFYPEDFSREEGAAWEETERRVVRRESTKFRDLVLSSTQRGEPTKEKAAEILAEEVIGGRLKLKGWDAAVEQWIARLNSLAAWMPELELPTIGDDDRRLLVSQVCLGATRYKEIKDRSVFPALKDWLSAPQHATLNAYAPERLSLANGRQVKIIYENDGAPFFRAKLQHLYDVDENPRVADGRVPVVAEILAPNQRPVQKTADLAGFWANSYDAVKSQLRGRYPKHEWR